MLRLVLSHSPECNHIATSNHKEGCRIHSSEDLKGLLLKKKKRMDFGGQLASPAPSPFRTQLKCPFFRETV